MLAAVLLPFPQAGHDLFLQAVKKPFGERPPQPLAILSSLSCLPSDIINPCISPLPQLPACRAPQPLAAGRGACAFSRRPVCVCEHGRALRTASRLCPAGPRFPADMRRLQQEMWDDGLSLDFDSIMGEQRDKASGAVQRQDRAARPTCR